MHSPGNESRPRRFRSRRWVLGLALAVAALVTVAVPVAWASDIFADVPTGSPHHNDINAIYGARITGGCATGPLRYCPSDPVPRDQMASFMHRGLGRAQAAGTTADITLTGSFQDIAVASIDTGGTTGGTGVVIAIGDFSIFATVGTLANNARVEFDLTQDGGSASNVGTAAIWPGSSHSTASAAKTWFFLVPTGATQTFRLRARLASAEASDLNDVSARVRHLTLLYVPFWSGFSLASAAAGPGQGTASTLDMDGSDRN